MNKFFKQLVADAVRKNNMMNLRIVFVSLISADNNVTPQQYKDNCEMLSALCEELSEYPDNEVLQNMKTMAENYIKKYGSNEVKE